jgi:hypothetical protein
MPGYAGLQKKQGGKMLENDIFGGAVSGAGGA